MNSVKSRDESKEEEIQESKPTKKQPVSQENYSDKKSQEAEKKRREFFGATIFDEDELSENNDKIEDDILNVPAFFRRKK